MIIQRHWFLCVLVMTYLESETQFQLMIMEIINISLHNSLNQQNLELHNNYIFKCFTYVKMIFDIKIVFEIEMNKSHHVKKVP